MPLYERLRGPNQWPDAPSDLRAVVVQWLRETEDLARLLTKALAASLGVHRNALDGLFGRAPHIQGKIAHYPAASTLSSPQELGVGAHTDSGFLTLLLQDDIGGLEVLNNAGRWI